MQKSPALIIEVFEARQEREARAHKRQLGKLGRRGLEIGHLGAIIACIVWSDHKPATIFLVTLGFSYFLAHLNKRWALEDRLEALEKKAQDTPSPAA